MEFINLDLHTLAHAMNLFPARFEFINTFRLLTFADEPDDVRRTPSVESESEDWRHQVPTM